MKAKITLIINENTIVALMKKENLETADEVRGALKTVFREYKDLGEVTIEVEE